MVANETVTFAMRSHGGKTRPRLRACPRPTRGRSEHSVRIGRALGYWLQNIPMFDEFAVDDLEDVDYRRPLGHPGIDQLVVDHGKAIVSDHRLYLDIGSIERRPARLLIGYERVAS